MEIISEVFVILEDTPGSISELTRVIKKKRISIYAIGLFIDTARLHVSDPEKALEAIQANGYQAELRDVIRIVLPNHQGTVDRAWRHNSITQHDGPRLLWLCAEVDRGRHPDCFRNRFCMRAHRHVGLAGDMFHGSFIWLVTCFTEVLPG